MATLTRSVVIDAPVEKVFDYAVDIRNLWAVPHVGLADVVQEPEGVGSTARILVPFLGFHMTMGLELTEVVRPERIVAKISSITLDRPTWTYTFEPVGDGTRFTVHGEWHINIPAVGGPMEGLMVREHEEFVETVLDNVKDGVEGTTAT